MLADLEQQKRLSNHNSTKQGTSASLLDVLYHLTTEFIFVFEVNANIQSRIIFLYSILNFSSFHFCNLVDVFLSHMHQWPFKDNEYLENSV